MKQNSNAVAEIQVSYKPDLTNCPKIKNSGDVFKNFLPFFNDDTIALSERLFVGYLNRGNMLKGIIEHSKGGLTGTPMDMRLILSVALKTAATGIVLAHNHPSGNLNPSESDISTTQKLKANCRLFEIELIDHIIISPTGDYYSMAENNLL